MPKAVAAIVTEYRRHSHADVIVGKILEGYRHDGGPGPDLRVVSMYVDQTPANDQSRELARRHGFRLCPTIAEALTLGGDTLAVDGVLSIGEHGRYPTNERGQILYPRRRFFEQICQVFERTRRSVPVFNDKHLAARFEDARWMVERARALHVPLLAGSSIPLTWRRPELTLRRGCDLTAAVQIGYGPLEGYGYHALEALQAMVERRRGGETGVRRVRYLSGAAMWQAMDQGEFDRALLEAAMCCVPAHARGDYRAPTERAADAAVFVIEYRDGLRAAVAMLNGWAYEGDGGAFCFAGRLAGLPDPVCTQFYQQLTDPFGHFIYLVRAIDSLIQTGQPGYPVERTLLVTGILDALFTSRANQGQWQATPELAIRYTPTDWPHATDPLPEPIRR
jgi:hypothetical protein